MENKPNTFDCLSGNDSRSSNSNPVQNKNKSKVSGKVHSSDDLLQAFCVGPICPPKPHTNKASNNAKQDKSKMTESGKKQVSKRTEVAKTKNSMDDNKEFCEVSNNQKLNSSNLKKENEIKSEIKEEPGEPLPASKEQNYVKDDKIQDTGTDADNEKMKSKEDLESLIKNTSTHKDIKSPLSNLLMKGMEAKSTAIGSTKSPKVTSPATSSPRSGEKKESETPVKSFSDEELKSIDQWLVDQMIDNFIKDSSSKRRSSVQSESCYAVKISPLEIADLAEASVQNLLLEYPQLSVIFKRQIGKFKKKKGFAEINFTLNSEVKDFLKNLISIRLVERKIDVVVSVTTNGKTQDFSLTISLRNTNKLWTLINNGKDPQIKAPGSCYGQLKIELVPSFVSVPLLQCFFPFCGKVFICRDVTKNESGKTLTGPALVQYNDQKWLEAEMECFSNFCIDGYALKTQYDKSSDLNRSSQTSENSKEKTREIQRERSTTNLSKSRDEKGNSYEMKREELKAQEAYDLVDDDAVSNMTRDVCSGMLESLDKLRQLDANNPNIERILQMREKLNKLQNSLPPQREKGKERGQHSNPWEVNQHDLSNESEPIGEKDNQKTEKSVIDNTSQSRSMKRSNSSMEEQSSKKPRHQEQLSKRSSETGWQQRGKQGFDKSNVHQMKSTRSDKSVRNRQEMEKSIKYLNDHDKIVMGDLQRQEEDARKEEERLKLIQKIEEARQRDSKKAEEREQNHPFWTANNDRRRTPSFSPQKSNSERGGKFDNKAIEEGHDDGVDQRLAAFERELAEQGVIKPHLSPGKPRNLNSENFTGTSTRDNFAGVIILMEDEYHSALADGSYLNLPQGFRVRIDSCVNRQCPVKNCPNTTYFKDSRSFMDHWAMFHEPETTMRFCQKCVAYFMDREELEKHLEKRHWISPNDAKFMVHQARVKVVNNPSYRDPGFYLPPVV